MEGHGLLNERLFWLDTLDVKQATYSTISNYQPHWIETDTLDMFTVLPYPINWPNNENEKQTNSYFLGLKNSLLPH